METLDSWLTRQYAHSAQAMLRSISATSITKIRAGFHQHITPKKGSVVASPVPGAYDPHPDYFFHWFRDSALVMDALRLLCSGPRAASMPVEQLTHRFADFIDFSLSLENLDGSRLTGAPDWRQPIEPGHLRFVRSDTELAAVKGEQIAADTRVNPDGSIDISRWARPQYDGAALRALCSLRWLGSARLDEKTTRAAETLLRHDLEFTLQHWAEPCFDLWEEELGLHYYTQHVAAAALKAGARWLAAHGDSFSQDLAQASTLAFARLESYWSQSLGYFRSRTLSDGRTSSKQLDIAVLLSAIHAEVDSQHAAPHNAGDPRMLMTLAQLERQFDVDYAINRDRPPQRGAAMGRYRGDVYFSGGAYYFSTLGAAEFCFRAASLAPEPRALIARGDGFLETVRQYTPQNGELSEQFDQNTGAPNSAPQLAWSYAALISAVAARDAAVRPSAWPPAANKLIRTTRG
jgi:glucoamylase